VQAKILADILAGRPPSGWGDWWAAVQLTAAGIPTASPMDHPGFRRVTTKAATDTSKADGFVEKQQANAAASRQAPLDDEDEEEFRMNENGDTGVDFTGLLGPQLSPLAFQQRANQLGMFAIAGLVPLAFAALRAAGVSTARWGTSTRLGQLLVGSEVADILTPGIDLPSPSDVPAGAIAVAGQAGARVVDVLDWFLGPAINFGGPSGPPDGVGGVVIHSWVANGVPFFQMSDGWTWVQKKNGQWKRFRQPKPVVLMPGGAGNLRTLLRATGVVSRQLKKVDKALGSKLGPRRRRAPAPKTVRVLSDGKIVNISND
jgi:hypothetical protein